MEAEEGGKPAARSSQPTVVGAAEDGSTTTALTEERLAEEVLHFPTNCPDCNAPAETNMKVTSEFASRSVARLGSHCAVCVRAAVFVVNYLGALVYGIWSNFLLESARRSECRVTVTALCSSIVKQLNLTDSCALVRCVVLLGEVYSRNFKCAVAIHEMSVTFMWS